MAYKQPKNTPMHNDGASEPITAILGAIKLGKVIAGAVKAAKFGKGMAKAGKVVGKAGKAAKQTKEMAKAGKAAAKAARKGMSFGEKAKNLGMQAENVARKGVDKVAKATGQTFEETAQAAKEKGMNLANRAASAGVEKIKENQQEEMPQGTTGTTPLHGYSNPDGPNMFAHRQGPSMGHGVKYDNHGASQNKHQTILTSPNSSVDGGFQSLHQGNIQLKNKGLPQYFLNNFSAPISIKGVQVDAGDIMRGLYTGGKMLTQTERYKNLKKSAQENKKQRQMAKIAKSAIKSPTKAQNLIDYKSNNIV